LSLAEELKVLSGQDVMACFQCGECSSSCQMTGFKGFSPAKLMHELQLGREEVLRRRSYEICLHCFICSVRCPQGLSFPDVATALSNIAARRYGAGRVERAFLEELSGKGFLNPAILAMKSLGISVVNASGIRGLRLVPLILERGRVRDDLLREVRRVVGRG